jgi:hypothetical protein
MKAYIGNVQEYAINVAEKIYPKVTEIFRYESKQWTE